MFFRRAPRFSRSRVVLRSLFVDFDSQFCFGVTRCSVLLCGGHTCWQTTARPGRNLCGPASCSSAVPLAFEGSPRISWPQSGSDADADLLDGPRAARSRPGPSARFVRLSRRAALVSPVSSLSTVRCTVARPLVSCRSRSPCVEPWASKPQACAFSATWVAHVVGRASARAAVHCAATLRTS